MLTQGGQLIANNSIISLVNLTDNPLLCVTTQPSCCDTNRSGSWFPPGGGNQLEDSPQDSAGLYQRWEDDQSIQLLRQSGAVSVEEGLYHCIVPDKDGVTQTLYVGISSSDNEGTSYIGAWGN